MKRLLILAFALVALGAGSSPGLAQQKIQPKAADKPAPRAITGRVTAVDPGAKTVTVTIQGKAVTMSSAKLKALPTVGSTIEFTENPATTRYKYNSCEDCNAVCPGVCFLEGGGDYCRCYLEHLRAKPPGAPR